MVECCERSLTILCRMSTGAVELPKRRPKNRKEEILGVAAELFARRGYAGVSVDEIGDRVGITGPALYRHFRSKRDVLTVILDRTMDALSGAATDPPGHRDVGLADPADPLRRIISRTTAVAMDSPAAFTVWLREARHHDPDTMSQFVELRRRSGVRWHAAERQANASLTKAELRVREEAVVAVINALSRKPTAVTRTRLEELATACAMAAVLVPPVRDDHGASGFDRRQPVGAPWSAPVSRQDLILGVAVPLFRAHGFAGVSIDQIGETAGLTGPSVYRYYDSKASILIDAFDRADARVAVAAERAVASARSADEALRLLIAAYAEIALDNADLYVVTTHEASALPFEERQRQSQRARALADRWVHVLTILRPALTRHDVGLVVRAMFSVIHQLVQLPKPPTAAHLAAIATAVATAELPGATP